MSEGKSFNLYLTDYLKPLFPNIKDEKIAKLKAASYEYFDFLLNFDNTHLEKNASQKSFFKKLARYEEAVKTLTELFSEKNGFWEKFAEHKETVLKTYALEQQISVLKADITEDEFIQLAHGKSAISLAIVDSLASLSDKDENNPALYNLLYNIHISFQYLEDLKDFKLDAKNGLHTYLTSRLKKVLALQHIDYNSDSEMNYKFLFITGVAQESLEKAIEYFTKAKKVCVEMQLHEIEAFCRSQILKAEINLSRIAELTANTQNISEDAEILL